MVIDLLDADAARLIADGMRDLYAEVYAEPPYHEGPQHVARFVEHYRAELDRPGFALARAVDGAELVGAAYGWTMQPGAWWSKATTEPPAELRHAAKFAIMEWMVRRPYRGRGIGRRLMDVLLASRPEHWAVLASNPQSLARRVYDRYGWQQYGTSQPDLLPPMDLLALPLHRPPEPSS